jgi:SAM-dependent methyltransferase
MAELATPSQFWDRCAAEYAKKPVPDEDAYAQTLERVRAHLTPNDRVLELGCGTGTTALKLVASAREIVATDYSAEMIAIASAKARGEGATHVRFQTCAAADPALGLESFDVVLAMNLVHLFDDVPVHLRRIRELVRPGGLFISKTPCIGDLGLALRIAIPLMRALGRAPRVRFVTEQSLITDVTRAGFDVAETGMYPKKSRSFFIVARKVPG